eukprot:3758045-Prymnesium_polylepis.1
MSQIEEIVQQRCRRAVAFCRPIGPTARLFAAQAEVEFAKQCTKIGREVALQQKLPRVGPRHARQLFSACDPRQLRARQATQRGCRGLELLARALADGQHAWKRLRQLASD